MARKKSVFSHTRDKTTPLSVKVPQELKTRIDAVKTALLEVDNTLVFNVSKVCCGALASAVAQGEAELSNIRAGGANSKRRRNAAAG